MADEYPDPELGQPLAPATSEHDDDPEIKQPPPRVTVGLVGEQGPEMITLEEAERINAALAGRDAEIKPGVRTIRNVRGRVIE